MKYIHYGHEKFDINLFNPVRNYPYFTKPMGGLWASSVEAEFGWEDWCKVNDFQLGNLEFSFEFTLKETTRILKLEVISDLFSLPKIELINDEITTLLMEDFKMCFLDFEKIAVHYDVIQYHPLDHPLEYELSMALYGWDCDSIVIMNPNVIIL